MDNETSSGNSIVGGFDTPTNQVENTEDNDGGTHPGSLQYYKEAFSKNGFDILSEYNFTYATCDYCPGEHTLLICSTQQPLSEAQSILIFNCLPHSRVLGFLSEEFLAVLKLCYIYVSRHF